MSEQAIQQKGQPQKQALALVEDVGRNALAKMNLRELKELAEIMVASGAFSDIKQVAQAQVKILAGAELGFSAIQSMTGVHFFNGKVTIGSTMIASLIQSHPKYEYKVLQHTDRICQIAFYQRIGDEFRQLGTPVTYTWEDAQRAQLIGKDNWKKYPQDMLFAACIRQGARRYCADIFRGTVADHDTEADYGVDTQVIEDQVAENVTIDVEPESEPNDVAEAVDTTTGEVIEVEPVNDDEPEPTDPVESNLEDLIASAKDRIREITGGNDKNMKELLGGRRIDSMDMKAVKAFHAELDKIVATA